MEKQGYQRTLALTRTGPTDASGAVLTIDSDATIEAYVVASGGTWPMTDKGAIVVSALHRNGDAVAAASGATFALSPMTGLGPVYASTGEIADPSLTATTTAGFAKFVDVQPGNVEVTITLPGKTCVEATDPWKGTSTGTLAFPVRAATMTQVAGLCE